jgi:cyclophilin family peptidyl-prolyl cis-trans isomerase
MAKRYDTAPTMTIDAERGYTARLQTDRGEIAIRLRADVAPESVNSFVFLSGEGFYDGCTFHRVIPGFVAQAGDPTGTGSGGPGYTVIDEISDLPFQAGAVGMANAGPNTNGSQFFIALDDAPHLNGRYTVFGEISEGMDVVRAITPRDPAQAAEPGDQIRSVTIEES